MLKVIRKYLSYEIDEKDGLKKFHKWVQTNYTWKDDENYKDKINSYKISNKKIEEEKPIIENITNPFQ